MASISATDYRSRLASHYLPHYYCRRRRSQITEILCISFVIGMTFQVADVEINTRKFRQLCLIHGILSFFFNPAIVAMNINLIAGLV